MKRLHRRAALVWAALVWAPACDHPILARAPVAPSIHKKLRALSVSLLGAENVRGGDYLDVLAVLKDPGSGEVMSITLLQRVVVLDALGPGWKDGSGEVHVPLALQLLPEEVEIVQLAQNVGVLLASVRNPEDIDVQEERGRATLTTLLTGERISTLLKRRMNTVQVIKGTSEGHGGEAGGLNGFASATSARVTGQVDLLGDPSKAKVDRNFDNLLGPTTPESQSEAAPAATRSWFPESFLFQPLIVTDSEGRAAFNVPVPDRLTTWRVLALAHSAEGGQAGTLAQFIGTLPAYVDPVVPGFLTAGDEVRLPLQVVNTTDRALEQPLSLEAGAAETTFATTRVKVPGNGSTVEFATLRTPHAGTATLKATFGTTDAVVREIPVQATGQPYSVRQGGTLGSPRTFDLTAPSDLDPQTAHVHLLAFPGALALLRSELSAAAQRGGVAEDAYALWLAGQAPTLFANLKETANPEALRTLTLLATQRVVREARTPSVANAAILADAAAQHPGNPLLERLTQRLAAQVARAQRPDGTFEGGAGWTLQQLLVVTADCVRAVSADQHDAAAHQRAEAVALRASGAFERNLARIQDPYTAAVVLDSGAVSGSTAATLRAKVREAIVQSADGSRTLHVPKGTVRPDGAVPSLEETTARAILALQGDPDAPWIADLGATLLGSYSAGVGWGDGQTNRVALRAVSQLFREPVPASVQIALEVDGQPVAHGELSGEHRLDVLALDAPLPNAAGAHHFTVRADPPLAGLGFALELQGHTPWKSEPNTGLELEIALPPKLTANVAAGVVVSAHAPAGVELTVHQALPAGVQAVTASLDQLVTEGVIRAYHLSLGAVDLDCPRLTSGQAFAATYRVIPTLAGTLHASASSVTAANAEPGTFHLPPQVWTVE